MFQFMFEMYLPKYKEKWKYITIFFLFVIGAVYFNRLNIPIFKTLFGICSICVISLTCFRGVPQKKILIYSLIYFLYIIWIDAFSVLGIALLTKLTILEVRESTRLLFLTGICSQIFMLCSYKLVISLFKKHHINDSIAFRQNIFLVILVLFEITLVTYMMLKVEADSSGMLLLFITICLLGMDLYLIKLFQDISQKYQLEKEIYLKEQQQIMQSSYYKSIETQYEHSRRLIHDMKNHIQTLEELYNTGNIIEAEAYAQRIFENMDKMGARFKCSSRILTIIFNDKILKCDEKGIEVKINMEDIDLNFIDAFDMTTIFSNLWDNAIEACEEVETDSKKIEIKIFNFQDFITISIRNTCATSFDTTKELQTTKGGSHMGIGLKNIRTTVEKYDGTFQFNSSNRMFEAKILIQAGL